LQRVLDPELGLSVLDVGLVYGVIIDDDVVQVRLTMTSAACPLADVIIDDLTRELDHALPAGLAIRVELVWEPPWSPERMSEHARASMGW
jgi:metal-sulfur cluster biosynthetic enzyme